MPAELLVKYVPNLCLESCSLVVAVFYAVSCLIVLRTTKAFQQVFGVLFGALQYDVGSYGAVFRPYCYCVTGSVWALLLCLQQSVNRYCKRITIYT